MSGNVIFVARNFTKVYELFCIVFIDFMALLKCHRSLCKFSCLIKVGCLSCFNNIVLTIVHTVMSFENIFVHRFLMTRINLRSSSLI